MIPLVLGEANCPQKLKQLYPIHVAHSDHTPTNRDINKLIRRLCLGKLATRFIHNYNFAKRVPIHKAGPFRLFNGSGTLSAAIT